MSALDLRPDESGVEQDLDAHWFGPMRLEPPGARDLIAASCAIGIALASGRPAQAAGAEHFCRVHRAWTCSAAPIRDPAGGVIGALNVSGLGAKPHRHTLGMVVATARAIENQLGVEKALSDLALASKYQAAIVDRRDVPRRAGQAPARAPAAAHYPGGRGCRAAGRRRGHDVFTITVPPLRERKSDISILVRHFLKKVGRKLGKESVGVAPQVMDVFIGHDWPGNVRELENVVERALALVPGDTVDVEHLPGYLRQQHSVRQVVQPQAVPSAAAEVWSLAEAERRAIAAALGACGGNVSRAAKVLGISRNTLYCKMRKFGITGGATGVNGLETAVVS